LVGLIDSTRIKHNTPFADVLIAGGYETFQDGMTISEALKRPNIHLVDFVSHIEGTFDLDCINQVEISIKYAGYIEKARKQAIKMQVLQTWKIPEDFDYESMKQLSTEGKQKLMNIRPLTIDQASRISGVNPTDIQLLLMVLTQKKL